MIETVALNSAVYVMKFNRRSFSVTISKINFPSFFAIDLIEFILLNIEFTREILI